MELPIQRIQTGLLAAGVFLGALFFSQWSFTLVVGLITIVSGVEFCRALLKNTRGLRPLLFILLPLLLVLAKMYYPEQFNHKVVTLPIAVGGCLIVTLLALFMYADKNIHIQEKLPSTTGMLWIGAAWAVALSLFFTNGPFIILSILLLIWISDSAAYFVGKQFGKTPLSKKVSPNKTVEGALGGLFFSILGALALPYIYSDLETKHAIILACIIVSVGITGDLIESRMKRRAEVKDSGRFLPGHGGLLDRFDSFMASIFFVYIYFYFSGLTEGI